jgi:formylglycine-generating enzyme required for sulfatase activity
MVEIRPGTSGFPVSFQMGCVSGQYCLKDERPVRTVRFAKPFAIGKYEVTYDEYELFARVMEKEEDLTLAAAFGKGKRPIIRVSWDDAKAYAQWLSEQTGKSFRLPTEAEWEYATRAGTETPWSFGADASVLGAYAWYRDNSNDQTHPVGERNPNPWGLHDVHGNVWEWVEDCWHDSYEGAPADGSAWLEANGEDCARRVLRGGSWYNFPRILRSAGARFWYGPVYRLDTIGFRLAQDL